MNLLLQIDLTPLNGYDCDAIMLRPPPVVRLLPHTHLPTGEPPGIGQAHEVIASARIQSAASAMHATMTSGSACSAFNASLAWASTSPEATRTAFAPTFR